MTAERLSDQQADFLCWLLVAYRDLPDELAALHRRQVDHMGVPVGRLPKGTSRAESASMSRALRRLEDRGLIERRNWLAGLAFRPAGQFNDGNRRTTHVRLTAEGWDLAERLTAGRAFEITGEGE